jgi:ComF family protein
MHMIVRETAAHGFYQGILRENLLALKFHGRRHLVRTLGALAGRAAMKKWPGMKFDTVVAVPLHRKRRLERGFDQACDLAYYTACEMGLKHRPRILRRTRNTPSQVGLTRSARVKNVHDAFRAGNVAGLERVLLVDDTMTTGATIASAARALRDGGVGSIFAAVVARTGPLETADGDVGGVQ